MNSLSVKHDLSLPFKKPNPCTRYISLICVTKEQRKDYDQPVVESKVSQ